MFKHRLFHPPQIDDARLARQAEGFCTKFCSTANSDEHSAPMAAAGRCLDDSKASPINFSNPTNTPVLQDTFQSVRNRWSAICYPQTSPDSHMVAIHIELSELAFPAPLSLAGSSGPKVPLPQTAECC